MHLAAGLCPDPLGELVGDVPFHLKWAIEVTHPLQKSITSTDFRIVDKFCYLGDMLSVDGDADAAVEARI